MYTMKYGYVLLSFFPNPTISPHTRIFNYVFLNSFLISPMYMDLGQSTGISNSCTLKEKNSLSFQKDAICQHLDITTTIYVGIWAILIFCRSFKGKHRMSDLCLGSASFNKNFHSHYFYSLGICLFVWTKNCTYYLHKPSQSFFLALSILIFYSTSSKISLKRSHSHLTCLGSRKGSNNQRMKCHPTKTRADSDTNTSNIISLDA